MDRVPDDGSLILLCSNRAHERLDIVVDSVLGITIVTGNAWRAANRLFEIWLRGNSAREHHVNQCVDTFGAHQKHPCETPANDRTHAVTIALKRGIIDVS